MKNTDDLTRGGIIDDADIANADDTIRTIRPRGIRAAQSRRSPKRVYSPRELAFLSLTNKRGSTLMIVLLTMTVLLTVVSAAYFMTRNYGKNVTVKENHITSARNAEQLCNAVVDMFSDIPGSTDSQKSDLVKLITQGVDYAAYMTNRYNADSSSEINPYPDITRKQSDGNYDKSYLILKSDKKPDMNTDSPPKDKNLDKLGNTPLVIDGWLDVPPSSGGTYDDGSDLKYNIKITFWIEPEKDHDGNVSTGVTGYAVFDIEVECIYKGQVSTASRIFKAKKRNRFEGYKAGLTATGTLGDTINGVEYIGYRNGKLIAGVKPNSDGSLGSEFKNTNSKVIVDRDREYFPWKLISGSPYAPPPYDRTKPATYHNLSFYSIGTLSPNDGGVVSSGDIGDDWWNDNRQGHVGDDLLPHILTRSDKDVYKLGNTTTVNNGDNLNLKEPEISYDLVEVPNPDYVPGNKVVRYDPPVLIPMSEYNTPAYNINNGTIYSTLSDVYFVLNISAEGELTGTNMYYWSNAGSPARVAGRTRQNERILVYQNRNGTTNFYDESLSIENTGWGYDLNTGAPRGEDKKNWGDTIWARFDLMQKIYKSGARHEYFTGGSGSPTKWELVPTVTGSYEYKNDGISSSFSFKNYEFYGNIDIRKGTSGIAANQIKDGFKIVSGSVIANNNNPYYRDNSVLNDSDENNDTLTRGKFKYSLLPTRSDMLGNGGWNRDIDDLVYNIEYKIPLKSDGTFNVPSDWDFKVSWTEPATPPASPISHSHAVDSDGYFKGGADVAGKAEIKYTIKGAEVKQNDMLKIGDGGGNYEYYIRTRFDRKVTDERADRSLYFSNSNNGFAIFQGEDKTAHGNPMSDPTYSETTSDVNPQVDSFGFPRRIPQYGNDSVLFLRYYANRDGNGNGGINLFEPDNFGSSNKFTAGKRYFVLIDTLDNPAGITYINLKDRDGDGVFNWFGGQGGTTLASSDDPSEAAQIMVLYTGEGEVVFNCDEGYQAEPNVSFMYYASMKDIWQRSGINQIRPSTWLAASWAGIGVEPWVDATATTLGTSSTTKNKDTFAVSRPISSLIGSTDLWKQYWNPSWADVLSWVGNNINFVTSKAAPDTPGFAVGKDTAKISFDPVLDYKGDPRCTTVDTYWKDVDGAAGIEAVASAQYISGFIYMPNYVFRYNERPTAIPKFKYGNTIINGGIVAAAFDIGDNNNIFYTTPGSYVPANLTSWGGMTDEWAELRDDVQSATDSVINQTVAYKARAQSGWGAGFDEVSSGKFNVILKIWDGVTSLNSNLKRTGSNPDYNTYELEHTGTTLREVPMYERILVRSMWIGKSKMTKVSTDEYPSEGIEHSQKKINGNKVLRLLIFSQIEQIPKKEDDGVMIVY